MQNLLSSLAFAALLSSPAAMHADSLLSGDFSIQGTLTESGTSLSFGSVKAGIGTQSGAFATLLSDGESVSGNETLVFGPYVAASEVFRIGSLTGTVETFTQSSANTFTASVLLSVAGYANTVEDMVLTTKGAGVEDFSATTLANTAVPEPSSIAIFGTGIFGLAGLVRRRFLGA